MKEEEETHVRIHDRGDGALRGERLARAGDGLGLHGAGVEIGGGGRHCVGCSEGQERNRMPDYRIMRIITSPTVATTILPTVRQ